MKICQLKNMNGKGLHLLCASVLTASCALNPPGESQGESGELGFTPSQLRGNPETRPLREQAVSLLERNGWCDIPESATNGWGHSYLVRHMACVSNKESTFGRATTGPHTGSCGTAYGYWQVAQCHIGKSVTYQGKPYRCDASGIQSLKNNPDVSARCALYVYMEAVKSGRRGIAPWEATCSRSEVEAIDSTGEPVFRPACGDTHAQVCADGLSFAFRDDVLSIESSAKCPATKAVLQFLDVKTSGDQALVSDQSTHEFPWEVTGPVNSVEVNLKDYREPNHDHVRIILQKNTTEYYRTNPSPSLP